MSKQSFARKHERAKARKGKGKATDEAGAPKAWGRAPGRKPGKTHSWFPGFLIESSRLRVFARRAGARSACRNGAPVSSQAVVYGNSPCPTAPSHGTADWKL